MSPPARRGKIDRYRRRRPHGDRSASTPLGSAQIVVLAVLRRRGASEPCPNPELPELGEQSATPTSSSRSAVRPSVSTTSRWADCEPRRGAGYVDGDPRWGGAGARGCGQPRVGGAAGPVSPGQGAARRRTVEVGGGGRATGPNARPPAGRPRGATAVRHRWRTSPWIVFRAIGMPLRGRRCAGAVRRGATGLIPTTAAWPRHRAGCNGWAG